MEGYLDHVPQTQREMDADAIQANIDRALEDAELIDQGAEPWYDPNDACMLCFIGGKLHWKDQCGSWRPVEKPPKRTRWQRFKDWILRR